MDGEKREREQMIIRNRKEVEGIEGGMVGGKEGRTVGMKDERIVRWSGSTVKIL